MFPKWLKSFVFNSKLFLFVEKGISLLTGSLQAKLLEAVSVYILLGAFCRVVGRNNIKSKVVELVH